MIAKVDATANDVPSEFEVKGFPTIYFVPAGGDKEPIVYDGAREVNRHTYRHTTNTYH